MANDDGIVISVSGPAVQVKSRRTEACDHCVVKDGCRVMGGGKEVVFSVENSLGAEVGDMVRVSVSDRAFLKVVFLVYLLPVLGLMAGVFIGQAAGPALGLGDAAGPIIFGFGLMGAVFAVVRVITGRMDESSRYKPAMVKIVAKAADMPADECQPEQEV